MRAWYMDGRGNDVEGGKWGIKAECQPCTDDLRGNAGKSHKKKRIKGARSMSDWSNRKEERKA